MRMQILLAKKEDKGNSVKRDWIFMTPEKHSNLKEEKKVHFDAVLIISLESFSPKKFDRISLQGYPKKKSNRNPYDLGNAFLENYLSN